MNSIVQYPQIFNHEVADSKPTAVLHALDLVEYEVEFRWERFEQLTLDAQHELELYDAAVSQRRELARLVSMALAEAEEVLR